MLYTFKTIKSIVDINNLIEKKSYCEPEEDDFPKHNFKYVNLKDVMRSDLITEYVKNILNDISKVLYKDRKYTLVDIKTHTLTKGKIPALPMWHFDCVGNPHHPSKEERHFIFLSGNNACNTEFLEKPIYLQLPSVEEQKVIDFDSLFKLNKDLSISSTKLPLSNRIYMYRRHLHRATPALTDVKRLMIRVTETSSVPPMPFKPFDVTYR